MSNSSGDKCPDKKCKGRLRVRTSERIGGSYVQYLRCNVCDCDGGKDTVPAERVWQRGANASS